MEPPKPEALIPARFEDEFPEAAQALMQVFTYWPSATIKHQISKRTEKTETPPRNAPCPCGKLKPDGVTTLKYKHCCMKHENEHD